MHCIVNEDTAAEIFAKAQPSKPLCPLCRQIVPSYIVDHAEREQVAKIERLLKQNLPSVQKLQLEIEILEEQERQDFLCALRFEFALNLEESTKEQQELSDHLFASKGDGSKAGNTFSA